MGLWDQLKDMLRRSEEEATKQAARAAASAAVDAAKDRVGQMADEALGAAEQELEAARARREGRTEYRPSEGESGDIAREIEAAVEASRSAKDTLRKIKADDARREAQDREDRARLELERHKEALRKARKEREEG